MFSGFLGSWTGCCQSWVLESSRGSGIPVLARGLSRPRVPKCSTRRRSIQSADTLFSVYLPCRSQITCHSLARCNDKTNNKNGPLVRRGGAIYRPAGGSFLGSFLGRSTGRWYPLGVSGCTAGWQRSVPAPAGGRRRHLGAGCYITPPIERLRPRSCSGQERSLHKGFVEGWNLVG